jgi:hypothetical protein
MGDDADRSSERRRSVRHLACFPAHITLEEDKRDIALIRDLSVTGALIYTSKERALGERVELSLYIDDPEIPVVAAGQVARCEARSRSSGAVLWPFLLGVRFDAPLTEHEDKIRDLAERQAKLGSVQ